MLWKDCYSKRQWCSNLTFPKWFCYCSKTPTFKLLAEFLINPGNRVVFQRKCWRHRQNTIKPKLGDSTQTHLWFAIRNSRVQAVADFYHGSAPPEETPQIVELLTWAALDCRAKGCKCTSGWAATELFSQCVQHLHWEKQLQSNCN